MIGRCATWVFETAPMSSSPSGFAASAERLKVIVATRTAHSLTAHLALPAVYHVGGTRSWKSP
jgi:hypothetical protein